MRVGYRFSRGAELLVLGVELHGERALARDGDLYAPHWDEWQLQWEVFDAAEDPAGVADILLDGA